MALIVKDRVRETSTSTGTGTITLNGAVSGFQSFTVIGDANTTYYTIVDAATGAWEVGIGTYTLSGATLSRDTILESSTGGTAVNFAAGTKDVFVTYPAERSVDTTTAQTLTNKTLGSGTAITAGTIDGTTIGGTTPAAGSFTSLTDSGNLTFTGTGNRITGDFSNATVANRVMFQTSTTNATTQVRAIPSGTGTTASFAATNNSDPTNSASIAITVTSSEGTINSFANGSGTALPMTFYTGGSERVRVDTSGNVGIGSTSPSGRLEVSGSSCIRWQTTDANFINEISTNPAKNAYVGRTYDASSHVWKLSNSNQMILDSSGNVGIGTSSPGVNLDVQGSGTRAIRARSLDTSGGAVGVVAAEFAGGSTLSMRAGNGYTFLVSTGAADPILFGTNSTERMRITSAGDVGIGTSSPSAKLTIAAAAEAGTRYLGNGLTSAGLFVGYNSAAYVYNDSNTPMIFGTNATERMRIDNIGNVSIGGAFGAGVSGRFLDVANTGSDPNSFANIRLITQLAGSSGTVAVDILKNKAGAFLLNNTETNAAAYTAFGVGASERLRITSAGKVGIGTTNPYGVVEVITGGQISGSNPTTLPNINILQGSGSINNDGGIDFRGSSFGSGYGFRISAVDSSGVHLVFGNRQNSTTYTEAMRLDSSGNLLVGTTSVLNGARFTLVGGSTHIVVRNSGSTAGKFWNSPYVDTSNQLYIINNSNVGVALPDGATAWIANSDERLKDIIEPISNAAEKVLLLRAVIGKYKTDDVGKRRSFLIAQDVEKVLPEAVSKSKLPNSDDETEYLSVAYTDVIPLIVAAFTELKAEFDAYKLSHP